MPFEKRDSSLDPSAISHLPDGDLPPGWTYNVSCVEDAPTSHFDILMLAGMSLSQSEIASQLGIGVPFVRRVLRHGPYREYLGRHRAELFAKQVESHKILHDAQAEIANNLLELIRNGKESVRLSAIKLYISSFGLGTIGRSSVVEVDVEDEDRTPHHLDMNSLERIRSSVGGV